MLMCEPTTFSVYNSVAIDFLFYMRNNMLPCSKESNTDVQQFSPSKTSTNASNESSGITTQ